MNCLKYHIKNVWVVPGDGREPVKEEVLVSCDGKILATGASFIGCGEVLDGKKKMLSPGFIDVHSHSDISVLAYPGGFSKVSQGITTEITGNCGLSAFPIARENREHLEELYANYNVPFTWDDFTSYREKLSGVFPDIIPLCGHNTLRAAVAGYEKQRLSSSELNRMKEYLDEALCAGSPGLSTGLLYVPGKFASEGEIIELMKVLAARKGIYATHLRSEGDGLLEALESTLNCAALAGLKKVQISHFKTAGVTNWSKLDTAIEMIQRFRGQGIRVTLDRYPYTESMTQLSVILPGIWADMSDAAIQKKLQNNEEQKELYRLLAENKKTDYWQNVRLASTGEGKYKKYCGKMFLEISSDPAALAVELLAKDATGTCAAFAGMSRENLARIMALDFCMPGSDGNAFPQGYAATHPRSFGTVPRFLRLLLDNGVPPWKAVRRSTGLPAETFNLQDRGLIREGLRADLVLFDPDVLTDKADFASPCQPAEGICWTMCRGKIVYRP